jgi:pimeloyl-ACP methyl ester carboxylesterase
MGARREEAVDVKAVYLADVRAFIRYLEVPGDGPPLLWLHGWQCSSSGELLPAAVQPALRGRRSVLIDFLGHGFSDKPADFDYTLEAHARTIVAVIDDLGIGECGLVGHSMGGSVAVLVATARPSVVSLLIMAESSIDTERHDPFEGQSEAEFLDRGMGELLASQSLEAEANPTGLRAAHLGMTRLLEPRATYRESASMSVGRNPSVRQQLARLEIPRWYLNGELSDADGLEADLATIGVAWRVVPGTGHPMGLQNPSGFAQTVADVVADSWST